MRALNTPGAAAKARPGILVVEDEPGTRRALELLLDLEGYSVVVASNGRQGLDAAAAGEFALVITDQMMPMMDGVAFVAELRRDPRFRQVPLIMLSASAKPPARVVAQLDAFIAKPFEIPTLLRLIERLLEQHSGGHGPAETGR